MNIRTKLLTIAALLAVWSCTEKDPTPVGPDGSDPIEFGSVSTKALVNSIADVDEFGVSIAISNNDNSAYGSLLSNERVYATNDDHTEWDYADKRYWLSDSHFYFVASYPYVDGGGFQTEEITDEDGVKRVAYMLNVETPQSADLDLLTETKHVYTEDDWAKTVKLDLGHLMTMINFKIKQDIGVGGDPDNYYYITKVTLSHVKNKGTYYVVPVNNGFVDSWTMEEVSITSFTKEFSPAIELTNDNSEQDKTQTTNVLSVWENEELLLIPQEIIANDSNQMKIRIDYEYRLSGSDERDAYYIEARIPASVDLWRSGKRITYNLSIAEQNDITFDPPKIVPWPNTPGTGTTIIIK